VRNAGVVVEDASMKIAVTGSVELCQDNDDMDPVTDPAVLRELDGAASDRTEDDSLAMYIDDPGLRSIGLRGGFIELKFRADDGSLSVVTEYESPRALTDAELRMLVQHTTDQWSDGLGESFECSYAEENGLSLDLAPSGQQVRVEQR